MIYLYLNELFPTVVRSLGNGFCQTAARIGNFYFLRLLFESKVGSVCSPIATGLLSGTSINPMIPLGIMSLIGALSVLPMRETFGEPLTDELHEKLNKVADQSTLPQDDDIRFKNTMNE
mgnify:CR=1 FL=1